MATEEAKRDAEIAKLEVETGKLRAERTKAENDLARYETLLGLERSKARGANWTIGGTILVATVAFLTFSLNLCIYKTEADRKIDERISSLLTDFGSAEVPVRIAAAISLTPHVKDAKTGPLVIDSLVYLLGTEEDNQVQNAIIEALRPVRVKVVKPLKTSLDRIVTNTVPLYSEQRDLHRQINVTSADQRKILEERLFRIDRQIKGRQWALISIALAIRDFSCSATTTRCVANFEKLELKEVKLAGARADLKNSSFRQATLWGADFFELDLSDSNFSEAALQEANFSGARLVNADFSNAHIEAVNDPKWKLYDRKALFREADLKGARFSAACLGGADFRGARNLAVEQFQDAFAKGADFDPDFALKLAASVAIKSDARCKEY